MEKYILRKDVQPMEPLTRVGDEYDLDGAAGNEQGAHQVA